MRVGHSYKTISSLTETVEYAASQSASIVQLFLRAPQSYQGKPHDVLSLLACNRALRQHNIKLVIHSSYMLNFCNPPTSSIHQNAVKLLTLDLTESVTLGAIGVVIHMGKNVDKLEITTEEAVKNYVEGVRTCLNNVPGSIVILETGAGCGTEVCSNLFELAALFNQFTPEEQERIKFCIDTCHVFAAGYDLRDRKYMANFEWLIGYLFKWKNIICVHLNDSTGKFDSGVDRHADIGEGEIGAKGIAKFVRMCNKYQIPVVLETPGDKISILTQMTMIREWCEVS